MFVVVVRCLTSGCGRDQQQQMSADTDLVVVVAAAAAGEAGCPRSHHLGWKPIHGHSDGDVDGGHDQFQHQTHLPT